MVLKNNRVAVIGAGVIGCSSALALLQRHPELQITIFHDLTFEHTTSYGPAGLFRVDNIKNRERARVSFERFTEIHKTVGGVSGVQLVSGHVLSDDYDLLKKQEAAMGDIVFNFRWLADYEMSQFANPSKYAIHFTSYTTEGRTYVPWLRATLEKLGARFVMRRVTDFHELSKDFDIIINCAGLNAGRLADDESVIPIRGVLFEIDAKWMKHFLYRDVLTIVIPTTTSVFAGTVKQVGRSDMQVTQDDRDDIWARLLQLAPTLKSAAVLSEWCGLRPHRESVRVEKELLTGSNDNTVHVIHNYGHGANGFTLSWGCAVEVVELVTGCLKHASRV